MTTIIKTTETTITVQGDYNQEFIDQARRLGGKWDAPKWVFDIREETAVRAASLECYGTDGNIVDLVDVQVTIPEDVSHNYSNGKQRPLELFGRTIARAFGRDSGAKTGDGIVVKAGGFRSGGSMKNWRTINEDNTVIIMRDVSRALVAKHDEHYPENECFDVEILERTTPVSQLQDEKEKLLTRLAEIDATLNESN